MYQQAFEACWRGDLMRPDETLSGLVCNVIRDYVEVTHADALEGVAYRLNYLEIDRLRSAASEVGLDTSGGKPALLLRLVEFMYSDVLLPPGPKDAAQTLAEKAEETLISSLDKQNGKTYLQATQTLGRTKLKSACLAIVRENHDEMLVDDPGLISMIQEEKDELWDEFIAASSKKGRKRTRGNSSDGDDSTRRRMNDCSTISGQCSQQGNDSPPGR